MGMSTHIVGFRPPDAQWRKMKAAFDACAAAGISAPKEVSAFFNHEPPDEAGVVVDIDDIAEEYRDDMREGYEIDLTKLPAGIKILRFYNSY